MNELLIKAKQGDNVARDKFIEDNIKLVHFVLKSIDIEGREYEDMFQVGCMGLVRAFNDFNRYDLKFSTFAYKWIYGSIMRELRDNREVTVPRAMWISWIKIKQAVYNLSKQGKDITDENISDITGLSEEEINKIRQANTKALSFQYKPSEATDDSQGLQEYYLVTYDDYSHIEEENLMEVLLKRLTPTERMVIELKYTKNKTQREIAEIIGSHQVAVSRLERRTLEKLRAIAKTEELNYDSFK